MAIEMKYSGKNDKLGTCVVTVGGVTKKTGNGEQARIVALTEIDAFEKTEVEKKELTEAFDELLRKAKDGFELSLEEDETPSESGTMSTDAPKRPRYRVTIDGDEVYNASNLQELRIEISNIPEPKFGL